MSKQQSPLAQDNAEALIEEVNAPPRIKARVIVPVLDFVDGKAALGAEIIIKESDFIYLRDNHKVEFITAL